VDGLQQLLLCARLQQIAVVALLTGFFHEVGLVIGGEDDHFQRWPAPLDMLQGVEAIEAGHVDFQEDQVGRLLSDEVEELLSVDVDGGDVDVRLGAQQELEPIDKKMGASAIMILMVAIVLFIRQLYDDGPLTHYQMDKNGFPHVGNGD
jgi:hypothetical protein